MIEGPHSANSWVIPRDKLEGRQVTIFTERKCTLAQARKRS